MSVEPEDDLELEGIRRAARSPVSEEVLRAALRDLRKREAVATSLAEELVSVAFVAAVASAESAGVIVRVVNRDGVPLPHTLEKRLDRINVAVDDGVVTKTYIG